MNVPIECKADGITRKFVLGKSLPKWLCKWWMRTRQIGEYKINLNIKRLSEEQQKFLSFCLEHQSSIPSIPLETLKDNQSNSYCMMPVQEFYCPWYAWPLEIIHRIIFGNPKLSSI